MNSEISNQYCTFFIGDLFLGIDVLQVQEVLKYQEMTRVPLASREISGLINLRGQTVTAIDLRRRIGLEDGEDGAELPFNVVIQSEEGAVSLLVDEIGEVVETHLDAFEEPPTNLRGLARELVQGVYKLDERFLIILDVERLVSAERCQVNK